MTHQMVSDVRAFNEKFGLLTADTPGHLTQRKLIERISFLTEELDEFIEAADRQDLADQADALVDLVYVTLGTAIMLGLPWAELWADVQRANMTKVRGTTKRNHAVDVTKPPGWLGPQTETILQEAGYIKRLWHKENWLGETTTVIDEIRCRDDDHD